MFTGIKDIASFVYRKSIPTNPDAGTFYWIECDDDNKLYFADNNCKLIRLDNTIEDIIINDDFINITKSDGNINLSINYGSFEENNITDGISKVFDVIQYIDSHKDYEIDEVNKIVKFSKDDKVFYTPISEFVNDFRPNLLEFEKYSSESVVKIKTTFDDNCDIYYLYASDKSITLDDIKSRGRLCTNIISDSKIIESNISIPFIFDNEYIDYWVAMSSKSKITGLWSDVNYVKCRIYRKLMTPIVSFNPSDMEEISISRVISAQCGNCGDATIKYVLDDEEYIYTEGSTINRNLGESKTYNFKAIAIKEGWKDSDWTDDIEVKLKCETIDKPVLIHTINGKMSLIYITNNYDDSVSIYYSENDGEYVKNDNNSVISIVTDYNDSEYPKTHMYKIYAVKNDSERVYSEPLEITFDLETLQSPIVSKVEGYDEYSDKLEFKIEPNEGNRYDTKYYYKFNDESYNECEFVDDVCIVQTNEIDSSMIESQPITLYVYASCDGFHPSKIVECGEFVYGKPYMYWDVMNIEMSEIPMGIGSILNMKNKISVDVNHIDDKYEFEISIQTIESSITDIYGRMIFAYRKEYGELTKITDNSGGNLIEQFGKTDKEGYYVYYLKSPSVYKDIITIFTNTK